MLQQRPYQFVVSTTTTSSSLPLILNIDSNINDSHPFEYGYVASGSEDLNKFLSTLNGKQHQQLHAADQNDGNLMLPQRPSATSTSGSSGAAASDQQARQQQNTRPSSTASTRQSATTSGGGSSVEQLNTRLHHLGSPAVISQRERFRSENLFRRLAHDTDVRYSGVATDRPSDERQARFRQDASQGELDLAFVTNGVNLRVTFAPITEWARAPTSATGGTTQTAAEEEHGQALLQRSSSPPRNQQPPVIPFERVDQLFATPYMLQAAASSSTAQPPQSLATGQRFAFAGMQFMQQPAALMMPRYSHQQPQQQYSFQQHPQQQPMMFAAHQPTPQQQTLYAVPAAVRLAAAATTASSFLQPNLPIIVPALHAPLSTSAITATTSSTTEEFSSSATRHPPQLERDAHGNIIRIRIRAPVVLNGVCCIFRGHINAASEHLEGEGKLELDEARAASTARMEA